MVCVYLLEYSNLDPTIRFLQRFDACSTTLRCRSTKPSLVRATPTLHSRPARRPAPLPLSKSLNKLLRIVIVIYRAQTAKTLNCKTKGSINQSILPAGTALALWPEIPQAILTSSKTLKSTMLSISLLALTIFHYPSSFQRHFCQK